MKRRIRFDSIHFRFALVVWISFFFLIRSFIEKKREYNWTSLFCIIGFLEREIIRKLWDKRMKEKKNTRTWNHSHDECPWLQFFPQITFSFTVDHPMLCLVRLLCWLLNCSYFFSFSHISDSLIFQLLKTKEKQNWPLVARIYTL